MRFICLLPVRDEADIILQSLGSLLNWADLIYVFDTGSSDQTWEIVQEIASRDRRVIPLKKEPVYFSETRLRSWIFNQARKQMREGDWFLRVDADEFHHVAPPEFVRTRMRKHETVAYHQYYDFHLTESEARAWERGEESVTDRDRLIEDRRRHYTISSYSEPRLCRYRETMQWPETVSFPFNAGYVAKERLSIRHYPHRDLEQLRRRCFLRAATMADPENRRNWSRPELHHWSESEWRKFVTPNDLPELHYWEPGTELPVVQQKSHLRAPPIRVVQRLAHRFALPILDRRRTSFPPDARPQPISGVILDRLAHECSKNDSSVAS